MLVPRTVTFSSQVYSIETIKKAAYRFSDVLSVDIIPRSDRDRMRSSLCFGSEGGRAG